MDQNLNKFYKLCQAAISCQCEKVLHLTWKKNDNEESLLSYIMITYDTAWKHTMSA